MYTLLFFLLTSISLSYAMEEGAQLGKRVRFSLPEESQQLKEETELKKRKTLKEYSSEQYIFIKEKGGKRKIALSKVVLPYASFLQTPFPDNTFALPFPEQQFKPVLKALLACARHETIEECKAEISRIFTNHSKEQMYQVADFLGSDKILDTIALLYADEIYHEIWEAHKNLIPQNIKKILEMRFLSSPQQQDLLERIKRCYFIFHHMLLQELEEFRSVSFSPLTVRELLRFKYVSPDTGTLSLANYKLKSLDGIENIPHLETVKTLRLSYNDLKKIDLELFQKYFPNLKHLNLTNNQIATIIGSFASLKLETLVLKNNRIKHLADHLKNATTLTELNLAGNFNLSKEEQQKIKEYLPNTAIIYE